MFCFAAAVVGGTTNDPAFDEAAAAMSIGLLAGLAYGLGIWIEAPTVFSSSNGLLATPLPLTWGSLLLVALVAAATADRAALRGRALQDASSPTAR